MRKKPTADAEGSVLIASHRRCALCFGLRGDLRQKNGQIVHVDRVASNSKVDNLCWLCLEHHDEYDTRRSQSKSFTPAELRHYREALYKYLTKLGPAALTGATHPSIENSPFFSLVSPSVSAGMMDLTVRNDGAPITVLSFDATTPGLRVRQWYPRSLPTNEVLYAPTDLPCGQPTECIFQLRARDRVGAERLFQLIVDPRPSPAGFDVVELS